MKCESCGCQDFRIVDIEEDEFEPELYQVVELECKQCDMPITRRWLTLYDTRLEGYCYECLRLLDLDDLDDDFICKNCRALENDKKML